MRVWSVRDWGKSPILSRLWTGPPPSNIARYRGGGLRRRSHCWHPQQLHCDISRTPDTVCYVSQNRTEECENCGGGCSTITDRAVSIHDLGPRWPIIVSSRSRPRWRSIFMPPRVCGSGDLMRIQTGYSGSNCQKPLIYLGTRKVNSIMSHGS